MVPVASDQSRSAQPSTRPSLPIAGVTLLLLVTLAFSGSGFGVGRIREGSPTPLPLTGEQGPRQGETNRQARVVRITTVARAVRRQEERPPAQHETRASRPLINRRTPEAITPSVAACARVQISPSDRARQGTMGLSPPVMG